MTPTTPLPTPAADTAQAAGAAQALVQRTRTATTPAALTAYRTAARTHLPTPTGPGTGAVAASPAHPFVLAHTLAQHTVTTLTRDEDGFTGVVHLAQEIRTHHPLTPGADTDVTVTVTSARREARGTRLALTTRLTHATTGLLLAELTTTALLTGATGIAPFGTPAPAPHPGTTPSGEPHTLTHTLTHEDIHAYAHASGDLNPIHLDDAAARTAGFPGVLAHGMHLVALAAEEITDRHADGDPTRVHALGARFAAPVHPGTPLRLTLQPYDQGTVVRFTVATEAGTAVKAGWAAVTPGAHQ
ncbi:MaoC family dehydratase [Kitasatospora sp. NPDC097643]|uniref:MaoC family dehydratase n=1 Tax=Kitasatospora sp. NPDC097643 TaxID=3157230 RepID=UPI003317D83E